MEIKRKNGKFYIGDEARPDAILIYDNDEDKITINSVVVSGKLEGKGIGKLLLEDMISYARENNKKILPVCSFARSQMEKNYKDMIDGN